MMDTVSDLATSGVWIKHRHARTPQVQLTQYSQTSTYMCVSHIWELSQCLGHVHQSKSCMLTVKTTTHTAYLYTVVPGWK